jgi:hypothetical protein
MITLPSPSLSFRRLHSSFHERCGAYAYAYVCVCVCVLKDDTCDFNAKISASPFPPPSFADPSLPFPSLFSPSPPFQSNLENSACVKPKSKHPFHPALGTIIFSLFFCCCSLVEDKDKGRNGRECGKCGIVRIGGRQV